MGVNNMTYNIKVDNRGLSTERGSKSGSYNLDKISRGFLCEHLGQKYKMKAREKAPSATAILQGPTDRL